MSFLDGYKEQEAQEGNLECSLSENADDENRSPSPSASEGSELEYVSDIEDDCKEVEMSLKKAIEHSMEEQLKNDIFRKNLFEDEDRVASSPVYNFHSPITPRKPLADIQPNASSTALKDKGAVKTNVNVDLKFGKLFSNSHEDTDTKTATLSDLDDMFKREFQSYVPKLPILSEEHEDLHGDYQEIKFNPALIKKEHPDTAAVSDENEKKPKYNKALEVKTKKKTLSSASTKDKLKNMVGAASKISKKPGAQKPIKHLPKKEKIKDEPLDYSDESSDCEEVHAPKGHAKEKAAIKRQEELHHKREEKRRKIENKIQLAKEQNPHVPRSSELELAVAHELMRRHEPEEDAVTLLFMSMAAKVKSLPKKTANDVSSKFVLMLNEIENQVDSEKDTARSPAEEQSKDYNPVPIVCHPPPAYSPPLPSLLTVDMEAEVDLAFKSEDGAPLVNLCGLQITGSDLKTLLPRIWLNDQVINFYMLLLNDRSLKFGGLRVHAFNTFFLLSLMNNGYEAVASWTDKVDIFSFEMLFVPVHHDSHWCMLLIDVKSRRIKYYDSLKRKGPFPASCINALKNYLQQEMFHRKGELLCLLDWEDELPQNVPEQKNGWDCGVIAVGVAECLSRGASGFFNPERATQMRREMAYEILKKDLLRI